MQDAAGVTATWSQALNAGDATALSALYADEARVLPPGGPALVGRAEIESYWKADIGTGGTTTTVTPTAATAQGDLLHVEGTYDAKGKDGATLARGQYQQLWARTDGAWRVQHEFWRIDPTGEANTDLAERLTSTWTQTYNGGLTTTGVGGVVTVNGTIATSDDAITLGAVTLGSATTLNTNATTTAGDITLGGVTGGGFGLNLSTGAPGAGTALRRLFSA